MAGAASVVMVLKIKIRGVEAEESLHLQSNQKYLLGTGTENTPPNQLTRYSTWDDGSPCSPAYALSLDTPPKNRAIGWVFGSDEKDCDFRLAKGNETAVSGRHFTITFDVAHRQMKLINLSWYYTILNFYNPSEHIVLSGSSQASHLIPSGRIFVVAAGVVRLALEVPRGALPTSVLGTICSMFPCQISDAIPRPILPNAGGASDQRDREETPICIIGTQDRGEYLAKRKSSLGEGGSGVVAKATAHKTGKIVAIKTFNRHDVAAARAEIKLHHSLDHASLPPSIVKFIDYQKSPTMLIMEYQELGDLRQQSHQKAFTVIEVVMMLTQQLQALEYLHSINTTHRDVKPDNILVASRSPRLLTKLCDFGFSTTAKFFGRPFGTALYIAPEAVRGPCNNLVDIWALGHVALKYTRGRPRPINEDISAWGLQVDQYVRALIRIGPTPLDRLIHDMLSISPLVRPSAADCLEKLSKQYFVQYVRALTAANA